MVLNFPYDEEKNTDVELSPGFRVGKGGCFDEDVAGFRDFNVDNVVSNDDTSAT